jgi:hypothetical protein
MCQLKIFNELYTALNTQATKEEMYKLDSSKIKIYFNKMLDFSLEI